MTHQVLHRLCVVLLVSVASATMAQAGEALPEKCTNEVQFKALPAADQNECVCASLLAFSTIEVPEVEVEDASVRAKALPIAATCTRNQKTDKDRFGGVPRAGPRHPTPEFTTWWSGAAERADLFRHIVALENATDGMPSNATVRETQLPLNFLSEALLIERGRTDRYLSALYQLKYGPGSFRSNLLEMLVSDLFKSRDHVTPWEPVIRYNLLMTVSFASMESKSEFKREFSEPGLAHVARLGFIYDFFPTMEEFERTGSVDSGAKFVGAAVNLGLRDRIGEDNDTEFAVGLSLILSYADLGVLWTPSAAGPEWFLTIGSSTPLRMVQSFVN